MEMNKMGKIKAKKNNKTVQKEVIITKTTKPVVKKGGK